MDKISFERDELAFYSQLVAADALMRLATSVRERSSTSERQTITADEIQVIGEEILASLHADES